MLRTTNGLRSLSVWASNVLQYLWRKTPKLPHVQDGLHRPENLSLIKGNKVEDPKQSSNDCARYSINLKADEEFA
jgi:hypothetical protein